jgi:hypothetical protein
VADDKEVNHHNAPVSFHVIYTNLESLPWWRMCVKENAAQIGPNQSDNVRNLPSVEKV